MKLLPRRIELLRYMREVQWAPGHWWAHDMQRPYYPNMCEDLRQLTKLGLVERRKQNATRVEKHSAWSRTYKADQLLDEKVLRSKTSFEHQILDDMIFLSWKFGVKETPGMAMNIWPQILLSGIVNKPATLDLIHEGKNPHNIVMKDMPHALLYDQRGPVEFFHGEDDNLFVFHQTDRDTEQGRATEKSAKRQTWTWKIRHMLHFGKEKYWNSWYNFNCLFQTIVTVNETAKNLIKEIIKEESGGKCRFIGVAAWKDWGNHDILHGGEEQYPAPTSWAFTVPYERVGYEPFYLNKFWEL